jgi:hypothetical protein
MIAAAAEDEAALLALAGEQQQLIDAADLGIEGGLTRQGQRRSRRELGAALDERGKLLARHRSAAVLPLAQSSGASQRPASRRLKPRAPPSLRAGHARSLLTVK